MPQPMIQSSAGAFFGEDYHRFFVFSENIILEENGSRVRVQAEYDVNLMNNLVQCTSISLTPKNAAFRMKVNSLSVDGKTCILFGLTSKCYIGHPTWVIKNSIRYHSDTGGIFNGGPGLHSDNPYAEGDEVTCHVEYFNKDKSLVNFLKNDRLVFRQWVTLKPDQLYPTIGFENGPVDVSVDWPVGDLSHDIALSDLNQWIGWKYLSVDCDHGTITLSSIDDNGKKAFSLQAPRPFSRDCSYLEMTVIRRPDYNSGLALGVTSAVTDRFMLPGWESASIAYHSNLGAVIHGTRCGHDYQSKDAQCVEPDRLGVGMVYLDPLTMNVDEQVVVVYFTKNGNIFFNKCVLQPEGGFYPTVGMCTKWDKVKVDFSAKSPRISDSQINAWSNRRRVFQWFRYYPAVEFVQKDVLFGRLVRQRQNQEKITLLQYIKKHLSSELPYFKVKVTRQGGASGMCIGVANRSFPSSGHHIGTDEGSCAYSTRLGTITSSEFTIYTKKVKAGDEVGCYLEYASSTCYVIVFILNATIHHRVKITSNAGERVYPSITFDPTPDSDAVEAECWWPDIILPSAIPQFKFTNISNWLYPSGIDVDGRKMRLRQKENCVGHVNTQAAQPLSHKGFSYFEVKFLASDSGTYPTVGLSHAAFHASAKLGTVAGSIAYYTRIAQVLTQDNVVKFSEDKVHVCGIGDRAGCGIVYLDTTNDEREEQSVIVYFTKNGDVLYHGLLKMLAGGLYPTICFESKGDSVEVLTALTPPIHNKVVSEWIKDAKMNLPPAKSARADFGEDLMMDLIEYTDVVDEYKDMYGLLEDKSGRRTVGCSLYVSHCAKDAEKAHHLLETLTMEGHEVELSHWNRTLEDVSRKSDHVDAVLICLSSLYIHDDGCFQEFIILKSKGKPIVPILTDKLLVWPPAGNIAAFQSDFIRVEDLRVDFSDVIDRNDLLNKVQTACIARMSNSRSPRRASMPAPTSEALLSDHYYPRQRPRGLSLHEQASAMELPMAGPNGAVRTVVCNIL